MKLKTTPMTFPKKPLRICRGNGHYLATSYGGTPYMLGDLTKNRNRDTWLANPALPPTGLLSTYLQNSPTDCEYLTTRLCVLPKLGYHDLSYLEKRADSPENALISNRYCGVKSCKDDRDFVLKIHSTKPGEPQGASMASRKSLNPQSVVRAIRRKTRRQFSTMVQA